MAEGSRACNTRGNRRKSEGIGVSFPAVNSRFTGTQSRVHGGKTHTNPLTFAPVAGLAGAAAFGHSAEQMKREG